MLTDNRASIGQFRKILFLFGVILPAIFLWALTVRINHGGFPAAENAFLLTLRQYATPLLDHVAAAVSDLVTLSSISVLCYLMYRRLWRTALFWIVAIGGSVFLSSLLKSIVHRSRPDLWVAHASFSFPSGHATHSMAIALALVILLRTNCRFPAVVAACTGFVFLVGACRMYLGFHYPTDILAGWLLSLSWVIALNMLFDARYLAPFQILWSRTTVPVPGI